MDNAALVLIGVYSLLVAAASFAGGLIPGRIRLTHLRMQIIVSLVGGLMLGVALVHMLPHSLMGTGSLDVSIAWMMAGLLMMFFLLRAFHFHQHAPADPDDADGHAHDHDHRHDHDHDHRHDHDHDSATSQNQNLQAVEPITPGNNLRWIGMLIGLAIHTIIDGVALAAMVQAEAGHADTFYLFGLSTFLAVALHKPVDSLSIVSLMRAGGSSPRSIAIVNWVYAFMCPIGAALFLIGFESMPGARAAVVGYSVAFAAGVFLCISLGDLLPEVQFHSHNRLQLSAALLIGVAVSYLIGFFEPAHTHSHGPTGSDTTAHDPHAGHDHDSGAEKSSAATTEKAKAADAHDHDHDSGHEHDHDK